MVGAAGLPSPIQTTRLVRQRRRNPRHQHPLAEGTRPLAERRRRPPDVRRQGPDPRPARFRESGCQQGTPQILQLLRRLQRRPPPVGQPQRQRPDRRPVGQAGHPAAPDRGLSLRPARLPRLQRQQDAVVHPEIHPHREERDILLRGMDRHPRQCHAHRRPAQSLQREDGAGAQPDHGTGQDPLAEEPEQRPRPGLGHRVQAALLHRDLVRRPQGLEVPLQAVLRRLDGHRLRRRLAAVGLLPHPKRHPHPRRVRRNDRQVPGSVRKRRRGQLPSLPDEGQQRHDHPRAGRDARLLLRPPPRRLVEVRPPRQHLRHARRLPRQHLRLELRR